VVASPSAAATGAYLASLTFTGAISASVDRAQAPSAGSTNACGTGNVDVDVIIKGQTWSLNASANPYRGAVQYKAGTEFALMINAPDYDMWMSTGGIATYTDDKSLSLDVTMTNLMVPEGPGTTAHLSGSLACA